MSEVTDIQEIVNNLTQDDAREIVFEAKEDWTKIEASIDSTGRWNENWSGVFLHEPTDTYWSTYWSRGATEQQPNGPFEYEEPDFTQVYPTVRIKKGWTTDEDSAVEAEVYDLRILELDDWVSVWNMADEGKLIYSDHPGRGDYVDLSEAKIVELKGKTCVRYEGDLRGDDVPDYQVSKLTEKDWEKWKELGYE